MRNYLYNEYSKCFIVQELSPFQGYLIKNVILNKHRRKYFNIS